MKNFKPNAWLVPEPVVIIGTYDAEGRPNAMNAAWAGTWDRNQIVISLSNHATTKNMDATGALTVAFATVDTMTAADYVGLVSARRDPDKLARTGWTAVHSETVNAPVFTCFPMTLECQVVKKIDETATGFYLVAEIKNIVADEKYLAADGKPDVQKMNLISFDPVHDTYIRLGEQVGHAFSEGRKLINQQA